MKSFLSSLFFLLVTTVVGAQTVFEGNGRGGYGGTVGQGVLTISESTSPAGSLSFHLKKGGGDLNDAIVIYIDSKKGGYTTTAQFTDEGDGLRKAISGVQADDRAVLNMPADFKPDYAIAFDQGFGGIWELKENASHEYINSANLNPTDNRDASDFYLTVSRADLGLDETTGFKFLVTYVSHTGFRSNEFIGDTGPESNPQNSEYTATSFSVYGAPLSVKFVDINTRLFSNYINVLWQVADEANGVSYTIERSGNGTHFEQIGSVNANNNATYSFADQNPLNGTNFYRILFVSRDGDKTYSKAISSRFAGRDALKAFASYGKITARVDLNQKGNFRLAIVNSAGQPVYREEIQYDGTSNSFDINLNNPLPMGIYSVMLFGSGVNLSCQVLIK